MTSNPGLDIEGDFDEQNRKIRTEARSRVFNRAYKEIIGNAAKNMVESREEDANNHLFWLEELKKLDKEEEGCLNDLKAAKNGEQLDAAEAAWNLSQGKKACAVQQMARAKRSAIEERRAIIGLRDKQLDTLEKEGPEAREIIQEHRKRVAERMATVERTMADSQNHQAETSPSQPIQRKRVKEENTSPSPRPSQRPRN